MADDSASLSDLAELILAVGRLIQPPGDQAIGRCTPIESGVMRYIDRNPETSARAAAEATLLVSSNFSRVLRGLEKKGLVKVKADAKDARRVSLHSTALAQDSRRQLGKEWDRLLGEVENDPTRINDLVTRLQRINGKLVSRRRTGGSAHHPVSASDPDGH